MEYNLCAIYIFASLADAIESSFQIMVTIFRTFFHMLQVAAMVSVGFALLSLLESGYVKKLTTLISRSIMARPQRKAPAQSQP